MADFVQNGIFKADWLISDNFMQDIYGQPYIEELLSTLRSKGDIEEFIRLKDEQRRADFISYDASILRLKNSIKNDENQRNEIEQKIKSLEEQKQTANFLKEKIEKVTAAYPDNRRENLKKALSAYASNGKISDNLQLQLTKSPTGFFDKFKNRKKIENANKEFAELMQFCKDNRIYEASSDDYRLYKIILEGRDSSFAFEKINQKIADLSEIKEALQANIQKEEKGIKAHIENYDNSSDNIQFRKTENDNIRSFAKEKAPYIINPPTISKEEIAAHGLSEDFIEGQIMQSSCPGHVRASVRRFYEGLDRPAAPMVAFSGRDIPDEQGRIAQDDVLDRLRAKGIDAVKASDPRAVDPHVFVVDKSSIHAPFTSPDNALKNNILMLEAIYETPGKRAYLSNPLTREALSPAVDTNSDYRLNSLDIIYRNGSNYQKIVSEYIEKEPYKKLYDLVMSFKDKDKALYQKIVGDLYNDYNNIRASRAILPKDMDDIGSNLLQKYKTQLSPYILDSYLSQMTREAYEKGISSEILNDNLKNLEKKGILESVFHGGSCSSPYAVLCKEDNMNFVYGAGAGRSSYVVINGNRQLPRGAMAYAYGASSHNSRAHIHAGIRCGFLFEYESRGNKQEFIGIDRAGSLKSWTGGKFDATSLNDARDETAILPHQNKLKKMYLVLSLENGQNCLYPLELDENGVIKDKRWREFCELHNPVDDNLKGYMIERRNNMIADYDAAGKEKMMLRSAPIAEAGEKVAEKAAVRAGAEAVKSSGGIVSAIAKADNAVNQAIDKTIQAIDKTIDKGSELLNNNAVGRAYEKAAEKVADTKVVKAVEKTTAKVAEKAANTTVGKAVVKAAAKTAGSAVGKSVIKKIPLVSAAAGCYFAWDRIKDGDWKGACGEVASGVAGCFPGLGTAASAAIDVGLAAKDIKAVVDESKGAAAAGQPTEAEAAGISSGSKTEEDKKKAKEIILQKRGQLLSEARAQVQQTQQNNDYLLQQKAAQQGRG